MKIANSLITVLVIAGIQAAPALASMQANSVPSNSIKSLEAAIRSNPADLQVRRVYVQALVRAGKVKTATNEMEGLVRAGLRSADDFALLADCYRYGAEFNKAVHYYQESLNLATDDSHAKSGLALTYMLAGQTRTALKVCQEGLTLAKDVNGRRELLQTMANISEVQKEHKAASNRVAYVDGVRF